MNRRSLVVGTGVAVTGLLGGCLSDGEGTDSTGDAEGSEENAEVLNEAYDHLESASDELETQADLSFETDPDNPLSISGIEMGIEQARLTLDDFNEDAASSEQQSRLESAELWAAYLEAALAVLVELQDGFDAWKTAGSFESNDRYGDAADQLEKAAEHFQEGESLVSDAKSSWDNLDAENFEQSDVEFATTADDLDYLEDFCDASARFCEAGAALDHGIVYFIEGSDLVEQERFEAATSAYEDASSSFEEANQQYRDAETDVPQSFREDFINQTCWSGTLLASSNLLIEASEAAARGDYQTFSDRADEANAALDVSCGGENL